MNGAPPFGASIMLGLSKSLLAYSYTEIVFDWRITSVSRYCDTTWKQTLASIFPSRHYLIEEAAADWKQGHFEADSAKPIPPQRRRERPAKGEHCSSGVRRESFCKLTLEGRPLTSIPRLQIEEYKKA